MLASINKRNLLLSITPPQHKHEIFSLIAQLSNDRIGKNLPAHVSVRSCFMSSHGKHRIQRKYTLDVYKRQTGYNTEADGKPLFLGTAPWGNPCNCKMADFRLWSVARTAEEIKNNYQKQVEPSTTGLIKNFNFAEGNGDHTANLACLLYTSIVFRVFFGRLVYRLEKGFAFGSSYFLFELGKVFIVFHTVSPTFHSY